MGRNSKKASQVRKKRDRSKSKRSSKKLRDCEDSYYESSDESQSLAASSSFSSEENAKKRRSRSRARKEGKGGKKRVRSRLNTSESSLDSCRGKRRKSLKRKADIGGKKRTGKKSRRADSISSSSRDEDKYEKSESMSKKKDVGRRYDEVEKLKSERRRYRSPSPSYSSSRSSASEAGRKRKRYKSPSSLSSRSSASETEKKRNRYWSPSPSLRRDSTGSDRHTQNKLELLNKPTRRLNSVIVVATEVGQDSMRELDMDGKKNISAYNDNNYDSCSENEHEKDCDVRDDEKSTRSNIAETVDQIKESTCRTTATSSVPEREDLEVILRLKALENLKRIRRGPWMKEQSDKMVKSESDVKQLTTMENAADQNDTVHSDMKQLSSSQIESLPTESDKETGLVAHDSSTVKDQISVLGKEKPSNISSGNTVNFNGQTKFGSSKTGQQSEENSFRTPKETQGEDNVKLSAPADNKPESCDGVVSRNTKISQSQPSKLLNISDSNARPESVFSVVKKITLPTASTMEKASSSVVASKTAMATTSTSAAGKTSTARLPPKTVLAATPTSFAENTSSSQVPPKVAAVVSKSFPEKSHHAKNDEAILKNGNEKAGDAYKTETSASQNPSSSPATLAAEQESNKGEMKEGSQYQQKTMTVMRGGEIVEVNYKVYIPKKAPALARRKLRR